MDQRCLLLCLNSSAMLGNSLQQTMPADDIFRCIFLDALRVQGITVRLGTVSVGAIGFMSIRN